MTESESVALPFGDGPLLVAEDFVLSCLPHVLSTSVIIGQVSKDCNPFFEKTRLNFKYIFVNNLTFYG